MHSREVAKRLSAQQHQRIRTPPPKGRGSGGVPSHLHNQYNRD